MIGVSNKAPRLPVFVIVKVPPRHLLRLDLAAPCACGDLGDLSAEFRDAHSARVADHWDKESLLGVHGDTQVFGVVVGDLAAGGVDGGVDLGMLPQGLQRRLREEREEGQLDTLAGLEVRLGPVPELGDPGQVDLDHAGELSGHPQRLDHALRDDLAQSGHPLGGRRPVRRRPPRRERAPGQHRLGGGLRAGDPRGPRGPRQSSTSWSTTPASRWTKTVRKMTVEDWDRVISVNLSGAFYL
jgi:hypothetical protein